MSIKLLCFQYIYIYKKLEKINFNKMFVLLLKHTLHYMGTPLSLLCDVTFVWQTSARTRTCLIPSRHYYRRSAGVCTKLKETQAICVLKSFEMSGFYGQLAKEALGDDVSDVSDGELENMLAVII